MLTEVNAFGQDKVARYGWTVTSDKGRFRELDKRLLQVNPEYQREAFKAKQLELASNWSWIACGVLTVAHRDGLYWVVDGQHRKLAADRRSDIQALPCLVFDVLDVKDEARAFLATNTNRKPVTAMGKFKALTIAGDEAARLVDDVIKSCGLRLATASKEVGDFKAVAWALSAAKDDPQTFVSVMRLASDLALAERTPVHHHIVKGLQYINSRIDGGIDAKRFNDRAMKVGMAALHRGAISAGEYYSAGGSRVYALGMMEVLNKGLQNKIVIDI
jgi:hypothetical protein